MPLSCLDYAMSYLSKYPKTLQEIRILLYRKGYTSEQISATLETLSKNNFINDNKFAESYLYSEVVKKGKPVFLIKQKLLQKGIDKKLIEELIDKMKPEINQGILAQIDKELTNYKKKGIDGFEAIQKLIRKGYRIQDIKDSIKKTRS